MSAILLLHSMNVLSVSLEGAWQSDRDKTLEWAREHRREKEDYLERMATILGSHVMVYENGKICQFLMPQEYSYGKKKVPIYGMVIGNDNYEVLAENKHGLVIRHTFDNHSESIVMIIFESDDSFYGVSLDTEDYGHPSSREYFKRVQLPKPINWDIEDCYEL